MSWLLFVKAGTHTHTHTHTHFSTLITAASRKGFQGGENRAPPFKNNDNCNISTNTHPNHAFYAVSWRGAQLGTSPAISKRQNLLKNVEISLPSKATNSKAWGTVSLRGSSSGSTFFRRKTETTCDRNGGCWICWYCCLTFFIRKWQNGKKGKCLWKKWNYIHKDSFPYSKNKTEYPSVLQCLEL